MFGALKRLFSKPAEPETPAIPPVRTQPVKAAAPTPPATPAKPPEPVPAPATPVASGAAAAAAASPAMAPASGAGGDLIQLPLASIAAGLSPNLAALVVSPAGGTFALPVKTALAQLPTGAVKVSFGELRQGSPPGAFADDPSQDKSMVNLPLPQILASIDPALLPRRAGQKAIFVPESVTSIFGKVRPISAANTVNPAQAVAPEPAPASAPPPTPAAITATAAPPSEAPKPVAPVAPAPPAPTIPGPVSKPAAPEPAPSSLTRPPQTPTLPKNLAKPSGAGPLPSMAPKTAAPSVMPFAAPKASPVPAPSPSPAPQAAAQEALTVAISELLATWPPEVQQEIEKFQLRGATVCLPTAKLETAMKTGRVVFTWGELCAWLQPAPPEIPTANREAALELPLKVVAPLFMARRQPGAAQKKVTIAPQIPDLFATIPKVSEAPAARPVTAAAPTAPLEPAAAATAGGLAEIFGQPGKLEWTPQEITQSICALKGVAGSVMAMGDGLLMAGRLPAPLKTETVAAFLPQIVGRVSQYAGEMQLGAVTGVVVAAGRGQCALYKTGKLYLAVLGHPGEALPEAMIGRIAAELAKLNA